MKEILGFVAVVLTFVAYVPYYRDILRGKTHPHVYSWALWGLLTVLIVALQLQDNVGPAVFVTMAAGLLCLGVVVLGLKYGKRDITYSDKVIAVMALVAMGFWLLADQPVVSMLLVITADLLAFVPTVRKSWNKPYSETLSLYVTNTLRFGLTLLAVREYTVLTSLWLVFWITANALFSLMVVVRRKQLA